MWFENCAIYNLNFSEIVETFETFKITLMNVWHVFMCIVCVCYYRLTIVFETYIYIILIAWKRKQIDRYIRLYYRVAQVNNHLPVFIYTHTHLLVQTGSFKIVSKKVIFDLSVSTCHRYFLIYGAYFLKIEEINAMYFIFSIHADRKIKTIMNPN